MDPMSELTMFWDSKGLTSKTQPGRSKQLTDEQKTQLYQTIVEKMPEDVRFSVNMNWTSLLVAENILDLRN